MEHVNLAAAREPGNDEPNEMGSGWALFFHSSSSVVWMQGAPLLVAGLQLGGGLWLGVHPALGLEGDPMRLL